jgi:serine/threonine-protein kinase
VSQRTRTAPASRYELLVPLAAGGMAQVFVGQKRAAAGFTRLVAIKKAHRQIARDPSSRAEIIEEVRVASKIHHPNLVAVHDVEELDGELLLIMDYVEGATVSELVRAANDAGHALDAAVAIRIALDCCVGLHAAHTLKDEHGQPLALVHRDVSPQNILVGLDGLSRVTDFGIAKSHNPSRMKTTGNVLKGKVAYMAPEYVEVGGSDARVDVFALGVVVWEMLANERLFRGANDSETLHRVLHHVVPPISSVAPTLPADLDAVLGRALAKRPADRFQSAQAFADALEAAARAHGLIAGAAEVGETVERLVGVRLAERRSAVSGVLAVLDGVAPEEEPTTAVPRPPTRAPSEAVSSEATGGTKTVMTVRATRPSNIEAATPPAAPPHDARAPRSSARLLVALTALASAALIYAAWPTNGPSTTATSASSPASSGVAGRDAAVTAEAHSPPSDAFATSASTVSTSVASPTVASAAPAAPPPPAVAFPPALPPVAAPPPDPPKLPHPPPKAPPVTSKYGDNPY